MLPSAAGHLEPAAQNRDKGACHQISGIGGFSGAEAVGTEEVALDEHRRDDQAPQKKQPAKGSPQRKKQRKETDSSRTEKAVDERLPGPGEHPQAQRIRARDQAQTSQDQHSQSEQAMEQVTDKAQERFDDIHRAEP